MVITENYKKAFTEVYEILRLLEDEEFKKIPLDIITVISKNKNDNYKYVIRQKSDLYKQPMLLETKAILFNLFRDYLATSEQKEKIMRMQNEERGKSELRKQEIYNISVFDNKQKEDLVEPNNEKMEILQYKENIFKRLLNRIKKFII